MWLTGGGLFTGGLGAHYGGEYLGAAASAAAASPNWQVQLIKRFKPDIITGRCPTCWRRDEFGGGVMPARRAAHGTRRQPWTKQCGLRLGGAWARALDIAAVGSDGAGRRQECIETKDGLTLWEDHFYPEIIDPVTAQPLAAGEVGELVLTTLTKEAMPVVRYRTRDLTRLLPGTARTMRRMERLRGRSDDMLIIRGVNVFPSQIEAVLAQEKRLAPHYMLELRRPDRLDELDVVVETRPTPGGKLQAEELAELERKAEHLIRHMSGDRAFGSLSPERSSSQGARVLDLRPKI